MIPSEVWLQIFAKLLPSQVCQVCSLVCKEWKILAEDNVLWYVLSSLEQTKITLYITIISFWDISSLSIFVLKEMLVSTTMASKR